MTHLAARGINCPQPLKNKKRRSAEHAGRPAGGDHQFSGRHLAAQAQCRALRRRRSGAGEDASGGRDFPMSRANALSVSGWRPLFEQAASRADEVQPDCAISSAPSSISRRQYLAEGSAAA
jgi:homoserine kinase type II